MVYVIGSNPDTWKLPINCFQTALPVRLKMPKYLLTAMILTAMNNVNATSEGTSSSRLIRKVLRNSFIIV